MKTTTPLADSPVSEKAAVGGPPLTEDEYRLFGDFEDGIYAGGEFHHRQHVRMAWIYLRTISLPAALERFSMALQRFARRKGVPDLYHETITWAYLFLINERLQNGQRDLSWEGFASLNEDLMRWKDGPVPALYSPERLNSEAARQIFLLPDRGNQSAVGGH